MHVLCVCVCLVHIGCDLGVFWGMSWVSLYYVLGVLWICLGCLFGMFRMRFGYVFGLFLLRLGM